MPRAAMTDAQRLARPLHCYFSAFFFAAQYAFIRAACFFRCAALKVLVFLWPFSLGATVAIGFLGGRPRRLLSCKTSIARLSLSRSWISSVRICSVAISRDIITPVGQPDLFLKL
jgi:hypothetical protein